MPIASAAVSSTAARRTVYAEFVLVGIVTALLGPILPSLITRWGLTDSQAGAFFTAQYIGGMLGSILSGILLPHLGFFRLIALGLFLMSAGSACLPLATWTFGLAAVFLNGIGTGFTIPASNTWMAESNPRRSASALSWLNLAWGLGATIWPLAAAAGLRRFPLQEILWVVAGVVALMGLYFVALGREHLRTSGQTMNTAQSEPIAVEVIVLFAVLVFFYVGTETAIGGWIAAYGKRMMTEHASRAAAIPSVFWAALLTGRGMAPAFLRFWSEKTVQRLGLCAAAIGTVLLLAAERPAILLPAAVFCGVGLAPVFPITVAWMSHRIGSARPRLTGALFATSSLGGAFIPWLVGATSSQMSSLRTGLSLTLVSCCLLLLLSLLFADRLRMPHAE
jgi:fucose permease